MRNSGWYIPFWRKPKRLTGEQQPDRGEKRRRVRARTDEELEQVRDEWVTRYTRQVRALHVLGLSVGVPRDEITARYEGLLAGLGDGADAAYRAVLQDAYETLHAE